jgi:hypothetical protein
MNRLPIQLISTDFDGTLHSDLNEPRVPYDLQEMIAGLQANGVRWIINTGRDLQSLLESMHAARLEAFPDYLVVVERDVYRRNGQGYHPVTEWNRRCARDHARLFEAIDESIQVISARIHAGYGVAIYSDAYSPVCWIARSAEDSERIHFDIEEYWSAIRDLAVMRNDIYGRLSHKSYNKGTALRFIAQTLHIRPANIFAIGDHINDMPMLDRTIAGHLAAPANAVEEVKRVVREQRGWISEGSCGLGVLDSIERLLQAAQISG